jgi:hypothetical protein
MVCDEKIRLTAAQVVSLMFIVLLNFLSEGLYYKQRVH